MKWCTYNQSLVRRGEILIGFDVIDNWDAELKEMNKDKVGEPFHYPNTFLLLLGYAKVCFHLPYRQTEGIAQGHAKGKVPSIPDYSTISRRINKLYIKIKENDKSKEFEDDYLIIAIDSTGIKVTNRGQWLRDKWDVKKKGYLKIHIAVDIKTKKILSINIYLLILKPLSSISFDLILLDEIGNPSSAKTISTETISSGNNPKFFLVELIDFPFCSVSLLTTKQSISFEIANGPKLLFNFVIL